MNKTRSQTTHHSQNQVIPSEILLGKDSNLEFIADAIEFHKPDGLHAIATTDKGINYKPHNEDRVACNPNDNFFAVIDGLGGHDDGEQAAQILAKQLLQNPQNITQACNEATLQIARELNNSAGACFVSAVIHRGDATITLTESHVGDCALIIIRDGSIVFESGQDSYVDDMYKAGMLTTDPMRYSKHRNIINKYIGSTHTDVSTNSFVLEKNDRILLMSDGIHDNFIFEEIRDLIKDQSLSDAVRILGRATAFRMENAAKIVKKCNTYVRKVKGIYPDGFLCTPKADNRSLIIIDV